MFKHKVKAMVSDTVPKNKIEGGNKCVWRGSQGLDLASFTGISREFRFYF